MGHLLGYARVSTTDQQPQLQVEERLVVVLATAEGALDRKPW